MSKLKRCPFCGIGMETTNSKHYFHPNNDCILHDFGIDIENRRSVKAWNTRKPLEIIVERLEVELELSDRDKRRCIVDKNFLQFDEIKGYANGIYNAIEFVKEEYDICLED